MSAQTFSRSIQRRINGADERAAYILECVEMKMSAVTFDGQRWSNAEEDRIDLVAYDSRWPARFAEEAAAIRAALVAESDFRIEHFGSTAISGIAAKPIIDILIIPAAGMGWSCFIKPLKALGYVYWAENPRADRMFFVKGMPPYGAGRTHHVHVRTANDAERELSFRDYLIAHTEAAVRYEALKQQLARVYPTDREAYTRGKGAFIDAILTEAQRR